MTPAGGWPERDLGRRRHGAHAPSGRLLDDGAGPQLGADEIARGRDIAHTDAQRHGDRAQPARRQRGEVLVDDGAGELVAGVAGAKRIELGEQALAQAAGGGTRGPGLLQCRDHALEAPRGDPELAGERVDRDGKEAAGCEAAGNGLGEIVVACRQQQTRGAEQQLGVARLVRHGVREVIRPRDADLRAVRERPPFQRRIHRDLAVDELLERV